MKILIIDNHEFILESVKNIITELNQFTEIETVNDPELALEKIKVLAPDIIISDYKMSEMNGLELVMNIRAFNKTSKIIILSMVDEGEVIETLIKQGINGYIHKESSIGNISKAIDVVIKGSNFFCVKTQEILKKHRVNNKPSFFLSKRELEILKLIVDEFKNKDIAKQLNISVSTVETHKKNLIKKLQVKTTVGLVKYAVKNQLF